MQAVSDEQLIRSVADGEASCLGTLFERHHRGLYQYCLQLTRSSSMSEDLVQQVFLELLKHASSFRGESSCKVWIFNIARNVTFHHLRKVQREVGDVAMAHEQVIDQRPLEPAASATHSQYLVEQAFAELPVVAREVIWLGRFVFEDYEELARALGCTISAARVRMHRAMQQLHCAAVRLTGAPVDG